MTLAELIAELVHRKALIVHCLRPGKGEQENPLVFPADMRSAIDALSTQNKWRSCSLIWPSHVEAFGDIGIVLRPRSTEAIKAIANHDVAAHNDPDTGRLVCDGVSFSKEAVENCFANSIEYNEWVIDDADTIAVFVASRHSFPEVSAILSPADIPNYEPAMGPGPFNGSRLASISEISGILPKLPVLTFENGEIIDLNGTPVSPYEIA